MTQESRPTQKNCNAPDAAAGSEPVTKTGSPSAAETISTTVDSGKILAIPCSAPKQMRHEEFMKKKLKEELHKVKTKSHSTGTDMVNHPPHYNQHGVECIEAIQAMTDDGFEAYLQGNIMKYLWRYKYKNGLQDLRKAEWYLDKLIEVYDD